MSVRDKNKKMNLVIQDTITNNYKSIPIDEDLKDETIFYMIKDIVEENIKDRLGFKVDFFIVS